MVYGCQEQSQAMDVLSLKVCVEERLLVSCKEIPPSPRLQPSAKACSWQLLNRFNWGCYWPTSLLPWLAGDPSPPVHSSHRSVHLPCMLGRWAPSLHCTARRLGSSVMPSPRRGCPDTAWQDGETAVSKHSSTALLSLCNWSQQR